MHSEKYFFVAILPTGTAPPAYEEQIRKLAEKLPKASSTFSWKFSETEPLSILSLPNLSTVIFSSLSEGMSMTAIEARFLTEGRASFVHSDIHSFRSVFEGAQNSYTITSLTTDGIVAALQRTAGNVNSGSALKVPLVDAILDYCGIVKEMSNLVSPKK